MSELARFSLAAIGNQIETQALCTTCVHTARNGSYMQRNASYMQRNQPPRTTAGTTGQSRPFDRRPRPPRSFSLALPSFNVTDKTDCWVGALPVGQMVSGWPR
ncbi:hypothetical protein ACK3TF_003050 [Chlorella vulgaris]